MHASVRQITRWPDASTFLPLDSFVTGLAKLEGKKKLTPFWNVYKFVDRRFSRLKLVREVNASFKRAHQQLEEWGESDIEKLLRDARKGVSVQARQFVKDLRAFEKGPRKVRREINWENHESVLFYRNNKPVQLTCGDLPAIWA